MAISRLQVHQDRASRRRTGCSTPPAQRCRSPTGRPQAPEEAADKTTQLTVDGQLQRAAQRTLSVPHRQTVSKSTSRGASVAEAVSTLGVAPATVNCRVHHALHMVRQAIDGAGGNA